MSLPAMLGPTRGPVTQELSGDLQRWRAAALGGLGAVSAWSTSLSLLLHLVPVWASPPCPPRAPAGPGPQAMVRLSSAPSGCPGGACGTSEGPEAAELQPAVHRHQDPAPPPPPAHGASDMQAQKGRGPGSRPQPPFLPSPGGHGSCAPVPGQPSLPICYRPVPPALGKPPPAAGSQSPPPCAGQGGCGGGVGLGVGQSWQEDHLPWHGGQWLLLAECHHQAWLRAHVPLGVPCPALRGTLGRVSGP